MPLLDRSGTELAVSTSERNDGDRLAIGVYARLKRAIVEGDVRPNQRLVELDLAAALDTSRTPVREALQLLASDGLVMSRKRSWVVREHTQAEIQEIYDVRAALEGYAVRMAAQRATDAELAQIAALHDREVGEVATSPRSHLAEVNDEFHSAIVGASHSQRMVDYVRRNSEFHFNHRIAVLYTDDEAAASLEQHHQLVEALIARNGDRAEQLAREHIRIGLDLVFEKRR